MNKFLITLIVPIIETKYEVYMPNNRMVGTLKKYVLKAISEFSDNLFGKDINQLRFIDQENGLEYQNNIYIKDSGIKNGTTVIVI